MRKVKEDTALTGISELRTKIDEILKETKLHNVIIERRNKPVAVLISLDRYERIEEILESMEDAALGYLARERHLGSNESDYIDIDEAQKKIRSR